MIERNFIEDQELVKNMLSRFDLHRIETARYGELYIDPETTEQWEKYEFELEDQLTYAVGLRRLPYPPIEKIIQIAFEAEQMDEVSGAAALLFELDRSGQYIRQQLLNRFENDFNNITPERFEIIYWRTEIYDATNNQRIEGKSYGQINEDAEYYQRTAQQANELRKRKLALKGS